MLSAYDCVCGGVHVCMCVCMSAFQLMFFLLVFSLHVALYTSAHNKLFCNIKDSFLVVVRPLYFHIVMSHMCICIVCVLSIKTHTQQNQTIGLVADDDI